MMKAVREAMTPEDEGVLDGHDLAMFAVILLFTGLLVLFFIFANPPKTYEVTCPGQEPRTVEGKRWSSGSGFRIGDNGFGPHCNWKVIEE